MRDLFPASNELDPQQSRNLDPPGPVRAAPRPGSALRRGAAGGAVTYLQRRLNQWFAGRGQPTIRVDGAFGPGTERAVRAFQQGCALRVDGIVGTQTWRALVGGQMTTGDGRATSPPGSDWDAVRVGGSDIADVAGIRVHRLIAPTVERMVNAAAADGIRLRGWGYRDHARQIELRRAHCGPTDYDIYRRPSSQCIPPTARPGRSRHEQGLAIDFFDENRKSLSSGSTTFRWLVGRAGGFGFKNLPSEPWHWSVDGR